MGRMRSFFCVEKFNVQARANNFRMDELPEIMAFLHSYGVKGFLSFPMQKN
jgi:putative protease